MIVFRLKEVAEQKKLNRHQLSMKTGISYPTISKYWKGDADAREFEILNKLCDVLNCEPCDLITRQPSN
jgi:putative transcriptional regulator